MAELGERQERFFAYIAAMRRRRFRLCCHL